jgi:hypothetical protein
MKKIVALLKKLWANEPVLVAGGLAIAVTEGVLTATQAGTVADVIAGVLQLLALFGIRTQVTAPANLPTT